MIGKHAAEQVLENETIKIYNNINYVNLRAFYGFQYSYGSGNCG